MKGTLQLTRCMSTLKGCYSVKEEISSSKQHVKRISLLEIELKKATQTFLILDGIQARECLSIKPPNLTLTLVKST